MPPKPSYTRASPIREITELKIGSRPASRKPSRAIEDLRAIPWSFSWGQCRVGLPGWYGFGTAIEDYLGMNARQRQEGDPVSERIRNGIHISINGLAAGLRNTG